MFRRLVITLMVIIFTLMAAEIWAAGSCTTDSDYSHGVRIYIWTWTSDASGDVNTLGTTDDIIISGFIIQARFVPGTGVTDLYDVYLKDANGFDYLHGCGVDQSDTKTDNGCLQVPKNADGNYSFIQRETLSITVSGAGNAKTGTVYLYVVY